MTERPKYIRYRADEWSALYVDGKLDTKGDHYLIDERLEQILGVETRDSGDFILPDGHTVIATVEAVEQRELERDRLEDEADHLESQARALLEQARRKRAEAAIS